MFYFFLQFLSFKKEKKMLAISKKRLGLDLLYAIDFEGHA